MIQVGSIVKHFKFETLTDEEKAQNKYIYRVEDFAIDADDPSNTIVIYRAMYGKFNLYARPYSSFVEKLDKDKYPGIQQEYRFVEIDKTMCWI